MRNKSVILVAFAIAILFLASCSKTTSTGSSRTPFIGGTAGITINFEKDSPPPEVTDDSTFSFRALLRLKNDGEYKVERQDIKLNLVGFDPDDFSQSFGSLKDVSPDDALDPKRRDSEGTIIEGITTFASFPGGGGDFIPKKFSGNTEFTFRAEACYHYETTGNVKVCMLRDMINVNDRSVCKPSGAKTIYSSAAPVQLGNFRQSVVGKDKISFSFDIIESANTDIFSDKDNIRPSSGFDAACPRTPRERRQKEDRVTVEIFELPEDPVVAEFKCGGLDLYGYGSGKVGEVILVSGRRTITCTVDLVQDRADLEKVLGLKVSYNVFDTKETKVLIKHLADLGT